MDRDINERHQFFSYTEDDTPYFVTWEPDGSMTFSAGDNEFETWCPTPQTFRFLPAVVAHAGIEAWAALQIGFRHTAHMIEVRGDFIDLAA